MDDSQPIANPTVSSQQNRQNSNNRGNGRRGGYRTGRRYQRREEYHQADHDRGRGRGRFNRDRGRGRGRGRGRTHANNQIEEYPTTATIVEVVDSAEGIAEGVEKMAVIDDRTPDVNGNHDQSKSSSTSPTYINPSPVYEENTSFDSQDVTTRLPPLTLASGPPISIEGSIGGIGVLDPPDDPRLRAVYLGFPVSVHPLRVPNARAHFTPSITHSIIDFRFLRLSGLLHQMTPLRGGIDKVELALPSGELANVIGWADVTFDAQGYEFHQRCWVLELDSPVDIQLGTDWVTAYKVTIDWKRGGPMGIGIGWADAKRVRNLRDVYATL